VGKAQFPKLSSKPWRFSPFEVPTELPDGVHRLVSRGRDYYYFQEHRNTPRAGPRIKLRNPFSPECWAKLRSAQGLIKSSAVKNGPKRATKAQTYIYIIGAQDDGPVKIGISSEGNGFSANLLEPCGPKDSPLVQTLEAHGHGVTAFDLLRDRVDLLTLNELPPSVGAMLTNPPFTLANERPPRAEVLPPEDHRAGNAQLQLARLSHRQLPTEATLMNKVAYRLDPDDAATVADRIMDVVIQHLRRRPEFAGASRIDLEIELGDLYGELAELLEREV
jgi:hypothetical protein